MNVQELITTVDYSQENIIQNIIKLYIPKGTIDCDPTYSKGVFYKNITPPKYKFDLCPQTQDTVECDCRHLPLSDNSVDSIMFDPPFLATTGKSLKSSDNNNLINKRFGVYSSEKLLYEFYVDAMKEFYRVLKPNGILIFKCQDKVSSGKQYWSHIFIANEAVKIGFKIEDLFILLVKSRIVADWQIKHQKHARKFHSYFFVLQKESE